MRMRMIRRKEEPRTAALPTSVVWFLRASRGAWYFTSDCEVCISFKKSALIVSNSALDILAERK